LLLVLFFVRVFLFLCDLDSCWFFFIFLSHLRFKLEFERLLFLLFLVHFAHLNDFLGLLDAILLIFALDELSNHIPSVDGTRRELSDGFSEVGDFFLLPAKFNNLSLNLLFLCSFCLNLLFLFSRSEEFKDVVDELILLGGLNESINDGLKFVDCRESSLE